MKVLEAFRGNSLNQSDKVQKMYNYLKKAYSNSSANRVMNWKAKTDTLLYVNPVFSFPLKDMLVMEEFGDSTVIGFDMSKVHCRGITKPIDALMKDYTKQIQYYENHWSFDGAGKIDVSNHPDMKLIRSYLGRIDKGDIKFKITCPGNLGIRDNRQFPVFALVVIDKSGIVRGYNNKTGKIEKYPLNELSFDSIAFYGMTDQIRYKTNGLGNRHNLIPIDDMIDDEKGDFHSSWVVKGEYDFHRED